MRVAAKSCGRKLIAATILGLLMTTGGVAQTAQQKQPAPQGAAQPQAGQQQPRPPAIWVVSCDDNRGKLDCRAGQSVFIKTTGQRLLSVAVRVPADTKKPILIIQVPLGVYLPAGASLQIGKDEAKMLPFRGCDRGGCVAEYAITESEIAAMTKGSDLTISVQNQNQQPAFNVTIPVTGFAAAYAKVK
jgi:invasion protein IalB